MKRSTILLLSIIFIVSMSGCATIKQQDYSIPDKSIYNHEKSKEDNANKTLTIYYGTIYNAPMMDAITTDYFEATGIQINWQAADSGSTTLKEKFAVGEAPDLFQLAQFDLPTWKEQLADLSSQPWKQDVYDYALDAGTVNGKLYGWPHTLEASGIVYNKDLLAKAGIRTEPTTLEELKQDCMILKKAGIQSFGESWMEFGYLAHLFATPFAYESNKKDISMKIYTGEKSFADLKYMNNFFDLYDLTLEYGLGAESIGYNTMDQYPDFAASKMAMMKQGTWVERSLKQLNPKMNIGIFPVPLSNIAEENKLQVVTTTFLCVNKESKNLKEALAFLCWWHSFAQKYLVNIDGVVPPFYSVDTTLLGQLNSDMETYIKENNTFDGFGYEYWPTGFQINLTKPLQAYAAGLKTKEDTLKDLEKIYRE